MNEGRILEFSITHDEADSITAFATIMHTRWTNAVSVNTGSKPSMNKTFRRYSTSVTRWYANLRMCIIGYEMFAQILNVLRTFNLRLVIRGVKAALLGLRQLLAIETTLKMIKNSFYFISKVFASLFWSCSKKTW